MPREKINPLLLMPRVARTMREVEEDGRTCLETLDQLIDVDSEDCEFDEVLRSALRPDD